MSSARWRWAVLLQAAGAACQPSVAAQAPASTVGREPASAAAVAPARKCPQVAAPAEPVVGAAPPAAACFGLSEALQRELERGMVKEVRGSDAKLQVRVVFACSPVSQPPARLIGMYTSGHGGGARVVEIEALPEQRFRVRTLRAQPDDVGAASSLPSQLELSRAEVPESALASALERARTALAARISTQRTPAPPGQVDLGPIETSDDLIGLELRWRDSAGRELERSYHGHVDNLDAPARVPVQLAWSALAGALPEAAASHVVEEADRALLRAVWSQGGPRPWYAEQALLALATGAGSAPLIPLIVADLDAESVRTRALAVSALAVITGWDVRRAADGQPRPLAEVVADYRRECAPPGARPSR